MCNCNYRHDLEKIRKTAANILNILREDVIIYKSILGYNVISKKCFKIDLGEIIETLYYE